MAGVSFAQIELKPAVGFNSSRFDSDPDTLTADGRIGYQFGASLAVGRKIYIEPGIFYTRLAQKFTPIDARYGEFDYNADFIRIPVNLGWQFIGKNTGFAGLRIFLGPSMMIPVGISGDNSKLVKEDVKSPQFDFAVGAGLNIWLFFLDLSYGWGMTQQFKDDPITAKMQALYVNLGFRFKLKKDQEEY
jgi:hypothetical protein